MRGIACYRMSVTIMPEFDAYLMVDWSASSRPVTGKDSVWYCLVVRNGDNFPWRRMRTRQPAARRWPRSATSFEGLRAEKRWCWSASISRMATRRVLPMRWE